MGKLTTAVLLLAALCGSDAREFSIDYERDTFLMDGQPFRYVSGSAHYFRMPRQYWRDRLRKMRAAGLNAVSTYVEWSQHEPSPGVYNFDGDLNITEFVQTAWEEGLYTILRVGPYICAEREMGGLPSWLLKGQPDIYLRSSDSRFTEPVERWLDQLLPRVQPLLYGNGGPIILVQVENEFGFYVSCDHDYTQWLRDVFQQHVQGKAVLFTTDGSGALGCGKIPGVYATVDFGPGTDVAAAFAAQRQTEPHGPLVNSEFYPGWLTHWGEAMAHRETDDVVKTLKEILEAGANVNFYMFYGGTNFGFSAGANGGRDSYQSDITSYDYEAPLTEAGDLTDKYRAVKEVILQFMPDPNITVTNADKGDYGTVTLQAVSGLLAPKVRSSMGRSTTADTPPTFEDLDQSFGYLLYETRLPGGAANQTLELGEVRDWATVFLNDKWVGRASREFHTSSFVLPSTQQGDRLAVLVENLGRINFGDGNNDTKGLLSGVSLGGGDLRSWDLTSFELGDVRPVEDCLTDPTDCASPTGFFRFFVGTFQAPQPLDTFLDVSKLTKGLVFVNGFNLGRYWSDRPPQKTLYVPGVALRQDNTLVVLEEGLQGDTREISFRTTPIFDRRSQTHD